MPLLSLIAAVAGNNAIGKQQDLLCHLPNDLKHFKAVTQGHTVIMGRCTFLSLPKGALPNRVNIVLSGGDTVFPGTTLCHSIPEAMALCSGQDEVFIIGGGTLYAQAMDLADRLYITHIHHDFPDADTFFPAIDPEQWEVIESVDMPIDEKHPYPYSFVTYRRK